MKVRSIPRQARDGEQSRTILLAVVVLVVISFVIPIEATIQPSFQGLGHPPSGGFLSYATAVSADGSVVAGWNRLSPVCYEAFRWENGQMVGLGDLPGSRSFSKAYGVSADGSVIVGYSASSSGYEAFRWENGIMVGLGDLPGGQFFSGARSVSADGSVVVGYSRSSSGYEAFRWENGTMAGLGDLPSGIFSSQAYGVSADGSVIVGMSSYEAFIWDADNGMRSLKDVLENDCGLDLTGWQLVNARGISADGLTIVGYGSGPFMSHEGWIATIPEPASILLLCLGGLMIRTRKFPISNKEYRTSK